MGKHVRVSETSAIALLKAQGVAYTEHQYDYVEHGGAQRGAEALGLDPYTVVKTLVMQDDKGAPLVEPCAPDVVNRHGGYLVGIDPQVCFRLLGTRAVDCALQA